MTKHPRRYYPKLSPVLAFLNKPYLERRKHIQMETEKAIIDRLDWMGMLATRDGYCCCVCGTREDLTLDHIKPLFLGGKTELSNLQILCKSHNLAKGYQTIDYRRKEMK